MKPYFLALLFLISLQSCSNLKTKRVELIDFVPEQSSIIIKTSNFESLKNTISNNDVLQKISKTNTYKNLEKTLKNSSLINPSGNVLICFSKDSNDSLQYTIITKNHSNLFKTDSLKNYTQETLNYKNKTVVKSVLNNLPLFNTIVDSTFFASTSKNILDSVFTEPKTNPELKKIYSTTSNNKTCSVIIKPNSTFIKQFFLEKNLQFKNFTNYLALDIDANQNEIILNGITKATDSLNSIINLFNKTIPQENLTANITPSNSDGFYEHYF